MNRVIAILFCFWVFNAKAQVVINEFCAGNGDIIFDTDYYQYPPWIELFNGGNSAIDVSGYYLSDKSTDALAWKIPGGTSIPAKGYLIIWCDNKNLGLHTNFSLDFDGEEIVLSNAAGQQLDKVVFARQHLNVSFGRTTDGGNTWNFLTSPTPGAANTASSATVVLANPTVSLKSGKYSGEQSVALSHAQTGVQIRYTVDGSEPAASSQAYTAPIAITKNTTLKSKAFHTSFIPSKTEVKTYFINERDFTLPIVSISMAPDYLWDNTIGIYTDGTNGIEGACSTGPVNWYQNWYRHGDFELFTPGGEKQFDYSVDIRIGGYCSRRRPQKTLVLKARDEYGSSTIKEDMFPNKRNQSFGGLFLRNSGTDWNNTHFRDGFMQTLVIGQMDIDYLEYQPTIVFLNGEYWGIQNLREKIDGDYIKSNYAIKKSEIDLLERRETVLEGSNEHFNTYLDNLSKIDRSKPEAMEFIQQHIDVQEFINYFVANIYYANTDWPGANTKWWRERSSEGKYRWILYDTDWGFGGHARSYATHPTLEYVTDPASTDGANPEWSTRHLRMLLENPGFRTRFIQTLTTATTTTFRPERVDKMITQFRDRLKAEMPYHRARFGGTMAQWNTNVDRLRIFNTERAAFMVQHIKNFFGYSESVFVSTESSPEAAGKVVLNEIIVEGSVNGAEYLKGLEYEVKPKPNPGYAFKHWQVTKQQAVKTQVITKEDTWKYFDKGSLPAQNWMTGSYNDDTWASGQGQFGYGEGDEKTTVSFGSSSTSKYITTYFRKTLSFPAGQNFDNIQGSILFDDGAVIYVNGVEVYRGNMPDGSIAYSTLASQSIGDENRYRFFEINKDLIVPGDNIIAVEVHQDRASSDDLSFDLQLTAVSYQDIETNTVSSPVLKATADTDVKIVAVYENAPVIQNLVINEFSASQTIYLDDFDQDEDWIELFNSGNSPVDVGGLFITDNLSNKTKYMIPMGTSQTIIPAGGYLILWADDDVPQGPRHLAFKLSADGEEIGLYQLVGGSLTTINEVAFGKQTANRSFSRIPNGTGPFVETISMTPGAENSVVSDVWSEPLISGLYPNPADDFVIIEGTEPLTTVSILDVFGRVVRQIEGVRSGDKFDLTGLDKGLYFVKVQSNGKKSTARIVKK
jgi:hypothetical protein